METETIEISTAVYNRLKSRKQNQENFENLLNRLLAETQEDWNEVETLDEDESEELQQAVETSRKQTGIGLEKRQQEVIEAMSESQKEDETD